MTQCPKCHYIRQPADGGPLECCPRCGIVYAKFDAKVEQRREELKKVSEARLRRAALKESARVNADEAALRKAELADAAAQREMSGRRVLIYGGVAGIAVLVVIAGLVMAFWPSVPVFSHTEAKRSGASSDFAYIALGHQAVLRQLKDPDSASFRNERRGKMAVCGEVNAKNSFGGYVGYRRFVATAGFAVFEQDMDPSEFEKTWDQAC